MISPLPELVTLTQARGHVRMAADSPETTELALKVEQATAIVLNYIDRGDDDFITTMLGWTSATVPRNIQGAIMLQIGFMWRYRGDEIPPGQRDPWELGPGVRAACWQNHDPPFA